MRSYKRVLLGITITAAVVDSVITLLVVPVPLEGALGNELVGPLAVLAPKHGNFFTLLLLWSLMSLLWSIEIGFAYRLYIINTSMNESPAGPFINALLFGHPLVLIICLSVMYTRAFSSEEEKQRYVNEHSLDVSPNSALMLILPQKYREHTEFSLSCFAYGIIVFIAIALIIRRIRRVLTRSGSRMTVASLRMHRMLLRSLIWQVMAFL
ncbi:hypothetical protein Y032_0009g419 [Ancylostoma ceylanicum]|nr:hypothetical protein Y032_0009g419 [Ancylostoma ceylanicum]